MVQEQESRRRRISGRSPSYPGIGLEEAVEKARILYKREGRHLTPVGTIVQHWGYRGESGPALVAVAALKKFGLLEDEGSGKARRARLTPDAIRIVLDERENSPERRALLQEAALRPAIHRELWEEYGGDLPSDGNLRHRLLFDYHFTENAVRDFIRQFRETLGYADLIGSGTVMCPEDEPSGSEGQGEARPIRHGTTADRTVHSSSIQVEVRIPISLNQWVTVTASSPLDDAGWERLKTGLEFMKPGLYAPAPPTSSSMSAPQTSLTQIVPEAPLADDSVESPVDATRGMRGTGETQLKSETMHEMFHR